MVIVLLSSKPHELDDVDRGIEQQENASSWQERVAAVNKKYDKKVEEKKSSCVLQ